MVVDERLVRKLEEVLGPREARAFVREIEARGVTREELREELGTLGGELGTLGGELGTLRGELGTLRGEVRHELAQLEARMDLKLQALEDRMDRKLAELETRIIQQMNQQTKTFVRTFYVSNAAMVLAVATLAFGAARLA